MGGDWGVFGGGRREGDDGEMVSEREGETVEEGTEGWAVLDGKDDDRGAAYGVCVCVCVCVCMCCCVCVC